MKGQWRGWEEGVDPAKHRPQPEGQEKMGKQGGGQNGFKTQMGEA